MITATKAEIRKMTIVEVIDCIPKVLRGYKEEFDVEADLPVTTESCLGWMRMPEMVFLGAFLDDKWIGIMIFNISNHPYTGKLYAKEWIWYLLPEHRKSGIGMSMLYYAEEYAKAKKADEIIISHFCDTEVGDMLKQKNYKPYQVDMVKKIGG